MAILNLKSNMVMEETGSKLRSIIKPFYFYPKVTYKNELFVLLVFCGIKINRFLGKVSLKC